MTVAQRGNQGAAGGWIDSTVKKAGMDVASTTIAATGTTTGTAFPIEDAIQVDAQVTVTALTGTGTPSLTVKLQTTMDGTNWYDVGSAMAAITATGSASQSFGGNLGVQGRWSFAVAGTGPSVTFSIDTQARRGI